MESIMLLLDEMEGYLQECKNLPLSNKVVVNMEVIYEFMADLRMKLPEQIKRSERILEERDKLMNEAKMYADQVIQEAEKEAAAMVGDHAIRNRAVEEAEALLNRAKSTAEEITDGSYDYVQKILEQSQHVLSDMLVQSGKQFSTYDAYMRQQLETLERNRQEITKK